MFLWKNIFVHHELIKWRGKMFFFSVFCSVYGRGASTSLHTCENVMCGFSVAKVCVEFVKSWSINIRYTRFSEKCYDNYKSRTISALWYRRLMLCLPADKIYFKRKYFIASLTYYCGSSPYGLMYGMNGRKALGSRCAIACCSYILFVSLSWSFCLCVHILSPNIGYFINQFKHKAQHVAAARKDHFSVHVNWVSSFGARARVYVPCRDKMTRKIGVLRVIWNDNVNAFSFLVLIKCLRHDVVGHRAHDTGETL